MSLMGISINFRFPTKNTISALIYRKGFCNSESKRQPINNHTVVEKELGDQGIICIEDLLYEIQTAGDNFLKVNKFLW
jgi:large subunit ribosomal protein L7e